MPLGLGDDLDETAAAEIRLDGNGSVGVYRLGLLRRVNHGRRVEGLRLIVNKCKGVGLSVVAIALDRAGHGAGRRAVELLHDRLVQQALGEAPVGLAPAVRVEEIEQVLNVRQPVGALARAAPFAHEHRHVQPFLRFGVGAENRVHAGIARVLVKRRVHHEIVAVRRKTGSLLLTVDRDGAGVAGDSQIGVIAVVDEQNAVRRLFADGGADAVEERRVAFLVELLDQLSADARRFFEHGAVKLIERGLEVAVHGVPEEGAFFDAAVGQERAGGAADQLLEHLAAVGAGERLVEHIKAEQRRVVAEALGQMRPHFGKSVLHAAAVAGLVRPEIVKAVLRGLAEKIALRPDEFLFFIAVPVRQAGPRRRAVAAAVAEPGIQILMHIQINVNAVFFAQIHRPLHAVEICFIVNTGRVLDRVPHDPQPQHVHAVFGQRADGFFMLPVMIFAFFELGDVLPLIAQVHAVENALPPVFVQKPAAARCDSFHSLPH